MKDIMESSGAPTVGRSLLVPCVQEMASQGVSAVPDRYIRPDRDNSVVSDKVSGSEVPVIDMQRLLHGDSDELEKLDSACREWGFFQLVDHGVSSSLVNEMKRETEELFKLPMEEKRKLWQTPEEVEGFGQAFIQSDDQKLDWADIFSFTALPVSMRKPLFSELPPSFRNTMESYSKELETLAMAIIAQLSKALKIEEKETREMFEDGFQAIRINYYPPCPEPEKVIGIYPHSDAVGLTILLQVSDVEGLQVKKDGKWVPVMPLPGALVVNIGDILEIVTNGTHKSTEHRATVNSESERISIATFYSTNFDGKVGPAPSLITPQTPPLFKTLTTRDYFKGLFSRVNDGKTYLDGLRMEHTEY